MRIASRRVLDRAQLLPLKLLSSLPKIFDVLRQSLDRPLEMLHLLRLSASFRLKLADERCEKLDVGLELANAFVDHRSSSCA
jgi:hypothetical protein